MAIKNIKSELEEMLSKLKHVKDQNINIEQEILDYITSRCDTFSFDGFKKSLNNGLIIQDGDYTLSDNVVIDSLLYKLFGKRTNSKQFYNFLLEKFSNEFNCSCDDQNFKAVLSEYVLKVVVDYIIKVSLQRTGDILKAQEGLNAFMFMNNAEMLVPDCDVPLIANSMGANNMASFLKPWHYEIESYTNARVKK